MKKGILLVAFGSSIPEAQEEPGFKVIKVIKENKIYIIDEMIVSRPTLRLLKGIYGIGEILYPDVFSEDVLNEFRGHLTSGLLCEGRAVQTLSQVW